MITTESNPAPSGAPRGGQPGPVQALGAPEGVFRSTMKTYAEKLKDPRWQRKRLEIMQRDDFTCTQCYESKDTLHVHHHYYEKGAEPWNYPNEALTTLCESCHREVEEMRLEILKAITWEVPFMAIHQLATRADPFFISDIGCVLAGSEKPSARKARAVIARKVISRFSAILTELEAEHP